MRYAGLSAAAETLVCRHVQKATKSYVHIKARKKQLYIKIYYKIYHTWITWHGQVSHQLLAFLSILIST